MGFPDQLLNGRFVCVALDLEVDADLGKPTRTNTYCSLSDTSHAWPDRFARVVSADTLSQMNTTSNHAPNLTQRPPRSPRVRLGGYVLLARIIDKGRAELAGTAGEYKYNNPIDRHWFRFTGITPEALRTELGEGKGDGEILAWVQEIAPHKRSPWEIQQWSTYHNERGPDGDVETLEFFTKRVGGLSPTREDVKTWFDYLDLDDHVTFGGKA